jgi:hypothetical protein
MPAAQCPTSTGDRVHQVETTGAEVGELPYAREELLGATHANVSPVNEVKDVAQESSVPETPAEKIFETQDRIGGTQNPNDNDKAGSKAVARNLQYEIIAGTVRKVSRPSTPKIQPDVTDASNTSTPLMSPAQSITSHHSSEQPPPGFRRAGPRESLDGVMGRIRATISPAHRLGQPSVAPDAAKKFVECGDMADRHMVGSLTREHAPWPGAPMHRHLKNSISSIIICPETEGSQDETSQGSQFGYGNTMPINQASVREERFDPFDKWTTKNLKQLMEKNRPLLETLDNRALRALLEKVPNCFCGKMCARFDGIVPVYVCGAFRRVYAFTYSQAKIQVLLCQLRLVDVLSICMFRSGSVFATLSIGLNQTGK